MANVWGLMMMLIAGELNTAASDYVGWRIVVVGEIGHILNAVVTRRRHHTLTKRGEPLLINRCHVIAHVVLTHHRVIVISRSHCRHIKLLSTEWRARRLNIFDQLVLSKLPRTIHHAICTDHIVRSRPRHMNIEAISSFSSRHILLSPLLMGLIGRAKALNQVFMLMLFHDVVLL